MQNLVVETSDKKYGKYVKQWFSILEPLNAEILAISTDIKRYCRGDYITYKIGHKRIISIKPQEGKIRLEPNLKHAELPPTKIKCINITETYESGRLNAGHGDVEIHYNDENAQHLDEVVSLIRKAFFETAKR